jgi:hypothetical protein
MRSKRAVVKPGTATAPAATPAEARVKAVLQDGYALAEAMHGAKIAADCLE